MSVYIEKSKNRMQRQDFFKGEKKQFSEILSIFFYSLSTLKDFFNFYSMFFKKFKREKKIPGAKVFQL